MSIDKDQNRFRLPLTIDELTELNRGPSHKSQADAEIMEMVRGIAQLCGGKPIANMVIALSIIEACIETCPTLYSPSGASPKELFMHLTEARETFASMINEKLKEEMGIQ